MGHVIALTDGILHECVLDALTDTQLRAQDVNVADSGERVYLHFTADVTNSGDTTLITPPVDKRVSIRWIYAISNPTSVNSPKIKFRFGANSPFYNVFALSKRQLVNGGIGEALIVDLSINADVAITVIYELID